MAELQSWSTAAVNLPDHADNVIHTDEGARAAGFEAALVAGTTIYAYMTHVPAAAWGLDWVGGGGGELRLRRPVFDGDRVECMVSSTSAAASEPATGDGRPVVTAAVACDARATLEVWRYTTAPALRDGEPLPPLDMVLGKADGDYGIRCGDDLELYAEHRIAHPVIWANLANTVFKQSLVTGPWIHVRSRIHHEGVATIGSTVHIEAVLVDRFDSRAGERALVDMRIYADGSPVATLEHEAIVTLA